MLSIKMRNDKILADECNIFWNYPPEGFPYLREVVMTTTECVRRFPLYLQKDMIVIGYAIKQRRRFGPRYRRYFYIMVNEFDPENLCYVPNEGVDPLTIQLGVSGVKTLRCSEPPTPEQRIVIERCLKERSDYLDRKRSLAAERQRRHRRLTPKIKTTDAQNKRRRLSYIKKKNKGA